MKFKILRVSVLLTTCLILLAVQSFGFIKKEKQDSIIHLPFGGNTWQKGSTAAVRCITNNGIRNWGTKDIYFETWLRINNPGMVHIKLNAKSDAESVVALSVEGSSHKVNIKNGGYKTVDAGNWQLKDTGYIKITLTAVSQSGKVFADINDYEISGTAINASTAYVKNNEGNFFYWGRRGPSVHLNYPFADSIHAAWFYNEVTVPKDEDKIGSYFMADGFGEGYFGMQVNSATERRILFSIWSPFTTDDPKSIPADMQVKLLKKGADVHAGEFGNEGSGGQSYLRYNWKAGNTYKFLLNGKPGGQGNTIYTAYFFAPEENRWMLVASFSRPKTNTYLKRLHSFLENFIPEQGDQSRKVLFGNQWISDEKGNWAALNKAMFTYDNTAAQGYRKDYAGGTEGNYFYLQNGGFFNHSTPYKTLFTRLQENDKKPEILFEQLP